MCFKERAELKRSVMTLLCDMIQVMQVQALVPEPHPPPTGPYHSYTLMPHQVFRP